MRVYATEDNGRRHLVRLECDAPDCTASIKPHREIAESGWRVRGTIDRESFVTTWDYCPDHASHAD